MTDIETRFWSKVKLMPDGCLVWCASLNGKAGYGNFAWATGQPLLAHRAAWRLAGHDLPLYPYVLNHTCGNRWCVNVDHLEVVTYSQNTVSPRLTTTCRSGRHEWTEENIVVVSNGKTCRPCRDEKHRQWLQANA